MEEEQATEHLAEKVAEKTKKLSLEKQKEVLNFVETLVVEAEFSRTIDSIQPKPSTFYEEVVSKFAGCVNSGRTDLSTNKAHMEGFGKV